MNNLINDIEKITLKQSFNYNEYKKNENKYNINKKIINRQSNIKYSN